MINLFHNILNNNLADKLLEGNFGVEIENIRVDSNGNMSTTEHPKVFGDKSYNPYITTDFAECQIELITPNFNNIDNVVLFLNTLQNVVMKNLNNEYLWPYSIPPVINIDDKYIKPSMFKDQENNEYRQYLIKKYGVKKQLISGIHFNYSLDSTFLEILYNINESKLSFKKFSDELYLKIARKYLKYSWIIVYLYGSSPCYDKTFDNDDIMLNNFKSKNVTSIRNGIFGYRNLQYTNVSLNSLENYVDDINIAINNKIIIDPREYYAQLRLKSKKKNNVLYNLINEGVEYLEIRTHDINPYLKNGLCIEQLTFTHLLLVYCLLEEDMLYKYDEYYLFYLNHIKVSDSSPGSNLILNLDKNSTIHINDYSIILLDNMIKLFKMLNLPNKYLSILINIKYKIIKCEINLAQNVVNSINMHGYNQFIFSQAKKFSGLAKFEISANNYNNIYLDKILKTINTSNF